MIRWPRLLNATQLIQILVSQKNPSSALTIFHEAKRRYPTYNHNGKVYAAMIDILGGSNRFSEMKEMINLMRDDSCECQDSTIVKAISHYARAGMLDDSISLFRSIPSFNCVDSTQSFMTLLDLLLERGELEAAYRLFVEHWCGWDLKEKVGSLNCMMKAFCRWNRSDLALQVFLEMDFQSCSPDRESYKILMKALCEDDKLEEAIHLLHSMFWRLSTKGNGEDVMIYRILLDALLEKGCTGMAVEVLERILRKGLRAPRRNRRRFDLDQTCNTDTETMKVLMLEKLLEGVTPASTSYTGVIIDLYREGKLSLADDVLRRALQRNYRPAIAVFEAKVATLCDNGKIKEAVEVVDVEMKEASYLPSVTLYNILLKGLCESAKSATAVGYLEKMAKQTGCVANCDTYVILVRGLCQEGLFARASELLEEMNARSYWPSTEIYSMVVRGLCSIGRQFDAFMWLEEMISQDKLPEPCVWNSLVTTVCPTQSDYDCSQALALFQALFNAN